MGMENAATGGEGSSCLTEGCRACLLSSEAQGAWLGDLWSQVRQFQVRQFPRTSSPKSWRDCVF